MMSGAAAAFKTSVIVQVIFNIITIIEMVADYFTIISDNKIASICIITSFRYAESLIVQEIIVHNMLLRTLL